MRSINAMILSTKVELSRMCLKAKVYKVGKDLQSKEFIKMEY